MTRRLGVLDLDNPRRRDVVYTSVLGRTVLYYDQAWVLPLAVIATGLFLIVVRAAIRTGIMRMGDLMVGVGILLAALCVALLGGAMLSFAGAFWSVLRDSRWRSIHSLAKTRRVDHDRVCACHRGNDPDA